MSAQVYGNFSRYRNVDTQLRFYLPLLERLESQPGVVSVAVTNAVPLRAAPRRAPRRFDIEGRVTDDPERRPTTDAAHRQRELLRDHRHAARCSGRTFTAIGQRRSLPKVVVINRRWRGTGTTSDPIGTRISLNRGQTWLTIVGVVGDVRQFGLDQETVAQVYVPLRQTPQQLRRARCWSGPRRSRRRSRRRCATRRDAVDPNQPVENVQTLNDLRSEALAAPRLTATLLSVFAGLALLVTLAGIGGVIATSVIAAHAGVRRADGARRQPRSGDGDGAAAGTDAGRASAW